MSDFPVFDHVRPMQTAHDGNTIFVVNDRDVLAELATIEPLDDRADYFCSIPIRSVWNSGVGPTVELGPFSLDAKEVVGLHNALVEHMRAFPSEFKFGGAS
ncbi:hypothetical protein Mbo4_036 [Rhodococcus phage Mbo4]|uniref:Uncharacterized protein n=2 Tax=root TaxID=1 RepID=A0A9E7IMJ5_9CAUD|nr:hypothetical protein [Rhodococcus opacus]YP_010755941.1 hypothetical protein QEH50_gp36 [Rhodococcus phage Mbo4]EKT83080.1 hypothetical protein WSS_A09192 [Rhodococcus opacus M213]URG17526.1 hypothetical protein Mbo4_036 [Rhodococcus phage Mbo4]